MFKSPFLNIYLSFALAAALVYSIPVYFFITEADYTRSWLLYLGNFLFMIVIGTYLFFISRIRQKNPGMFGLMLTGEKQVLRSTALALLLSFILLLILIPGLLESGIAGRVIINKPANTIHDKTNGLDVMVIANAVIGNISSGSFASIILAPSLNHESAEETK